MEPKSNKFAKVVIMTLNHLSSVRRTTNRYLRKSKQNILISVIENTMKIINKKYLKSPN